MHSFKSKRKVRVNKSKRKNKNTELYYFECWDGLIKFFSVLASIESLTLTLSYF